MNNPSKKKSTLQKQNSFTSNYTKGTLNEIDSFDPIKIN